MSAPPTLQDGRYRLRSVYTNNPNPGVGGAYATGGDPSQPVTTTAEVPHTFDKQVWDIVKNPEQTGSADTYKINYVGHSAHHLKEGFSYASLDQDAPITLGPPKDFTFELWPGTSDVYVIRPIEPPSGFDICVGVTEDGKKVVITRILFTSPGFATGEVRPAWKIHRA
ncbi:hypothetical protein BOTBODRAFT_177358 [Botryobasidium botryosum FD-172 SS1]|uniref:Uncharacterized protein n=1 Tax=Botryobasidium botryosum (strain FD-172 SS1) TaxID=930990 RepID=A0A067M9H3_BOTB1|nr:hypothetical protein BOTBODRAFT_177358 [Botryobasidium botryosum FD-172 SS1]